jgi:hypothetical protein
MCVICTINSKKIKIILTKESGDNIINIARYLSIFQKGVM